MTAQEYLEQRVEDQIRWYDAKSSHNQEWFKRLRLVEIMAAATIPLLSGLTAASPLLPIAIGILGASVAIIAGSLALFQFESHWVEYRSACEALKREKFLYLTGAEPFAGGPAASFSLLVQRVEALLSEENTNWTQVMLKAQEAREEG